MGIDLAYAHIHYIYARTTRSRVGGTMEVWQVRHDNNERGNMSKVAVWCVISPKNVNPKQFGLAVALTEKPTEGDTVTAYNRHGASQVKVLGAVATNADGSPMVRSMASNVNGIPTIIQQAVFQVG